MKHATIEKSKRGTISVHIWVDDHYIAAIYGNDYEVSRDNLFEAYRIDVMTDPMFISGTVRVDDYTCLTHKPY